MRWYLLLFLLLSSFTNASQQSLITDSFKVTSTGKYKIESKFIQESTKWVRPIRAYSIPKALLEVSFKGNSSHQYIWKYMGQVIVPLWDHKNESYRVRIFTSLFETAPLELLEGHQIVNTLKIHPEKNQLVTKQFIDYSCAPFGVEISGMKDDLISVGCKLHRTGSLFNEKPYLEVFLTSASYRLRDQSPPPYRLAFHESSEANINLINHEGHEETITVRAILPSKLPRLKLAGGLGPYTLATKNRTGEKINQLAPTAMLYGNFLLTENSSLRFFDSYSRNVSTFHNWGTYFAWDLAEFCDQRCLITSLIGLQGVDYKFNSNTNAVSELIFPQGFEFVYRHAFNQQNYILSYGMFASFSGLYDYQNLWLRYGKKIFWELNFIEWRRHHRSASMVGLSIGFPLTSF